MLNNEIDVEDETKEYICDEYPKNEIHKILVGSCETCGKRKCTIKNSYLTYPVIKRVGIGSLSGDPVDEQESLLTRASLRDLPRPFSAGSRIFPYYQHTIYF